MKRTTCFLSLLLISGISGMLSSCSTEVETTETVPVVTTQE